MTKKSQLTFDQLCKEFFELEREENLYEWEVSGVQVWTLIRSKLLLYIAGQTGIFDHSKTRSTRPATANPRLPGKTSAELLVSYTIGWRWHLRAILPKSKDVRVAKWLKATELVMPFSTRNQQGVDQHSQGLLEVLGDDALVLGRGAWDVNTDRPHSGELQKRAGKYTKLWFAAMVRLSVTKSDRTKWSRIVKRLQKVSGAALGRHAAFPSGYVHNYLAEQHFYRTIFRRIPIRRMYIVNATSMNLMGALQSIGVPTIELQNGLFSEQGMQFHWPGRPKIKYLPAEIWTWGGIWTEGIENAGNQTVRVIGSNSALNLAREKQAHQAQGWVRNSSQVTVMSQPYLAMDLFKAAIEIANMTPKSWVIFKNHPRDDMSQFEPLLASKSLPKNFRISNSDETSLQLCASSEVVVGAFSATLLEALGLGAKVGILKMSGWESLDRLIKGNYAKAFDTAEDLAANLQNLPTPKDPLHFYGPKADLAREISELRKRTP